MWVDGYYVEVPDTPTATITALDGSGDSVSPAFVTSDWAPSTDSGNIVHQLLEPGQIAIVLKGDPPRSGTLNMVFFSESDAETARALLGRATTFELEDISRPVIDMTFARVGSMTPGVNATMPSVFEFAVGYQEVIP